MVERNGRSLSPVPEPRRQPSTVDAVLALAGLLGLLAALALIVPLIVGIAVRAWQWAL